MRPAESDADVAIAAAPAPRAERIDYASILSPQTKWIVLAGVLMGLFLAALDQTIVATALPAIIADLRGIDLLAWVSTGYLVASTTTVPVYGKLSDLYGRRIIVLAGIVIFLAGSALSGLAVTMGQLIAFRVLQGIGGGGLGPSEQAILADTFPPARRGMAFAVYGMAVVLAPAIGPTLGGFITDHYS